MTFSSLRPNSILLVSLLSLSSAMGGELHEAAFSGDVERIMQLVDQGADPASKDKKGRTPLDLATLGQDTQLAGILEGKPASGDSLSSSTGAPATDHPMRGNADAHVTLVQYADFACPYSARFYEKTFPKIKERYIDTGKLMFQYRAFPQDLRGAEALFLPGRKRIAKEAFRSAEAAKCALEQGEDEFWRIYGLMMRNQESLGVDNYKKWALDSGLDIEHFNECLDSGRTAESVHRDLQDGKSAGVLGTPTFFLNGTMITGAQSYKRFEKAIDKALQEAGVVDHGD